MGKEGFRELKVWQKAKDLAVLLYGITNSGIFSRDFGLRDQLRRAAVSVASNIAEGDERSSNKDSVRFLIYGKGFARRAYNADNYIERNRLHKGRRF